MLVPELVSFAEAAHMATFADGERRPALQVLLDSLVKKFGVTMGVRGGFLLKVGGFSLKLYSAVSCVYPACILMYPKCIPS